MSKTTEERVEDYLAVEKDLSLKINQAIEEIKDSIPTNQKCEFSRPKANPPYFCNSPAHFPLKFDSTTTYLCKIHYIHFIHFIIPFIQED